MAAGHGFIIPVGGAEEKIGDVTILRRFASLCGGGRPDRHHPHRLRAERHRRTATRSCSASSASAQARSLPIHARDGRRAAGAGSTILDDVRRGLPHRREPAPAQHHDRRHRRWPRRSGGATPRACTSAGTSAGAAFLCEHMIAFGKEGASPRAEDRDARARGSGSPTASSSTSTSASATGWAGCSPRWPTTRSPSGIGLDEDTAAFIGPDETLEVVGSGALTIVDPSGLEFSSMARVAEERPGLPDRAPAAHPGSRADVQSPHPGGGGGTGDRAAGLAASVRLRRGCSARRPTATEWTRMRILDGRLRRPQPVRPLPRHPARGRPRPARGVAVGQARAGLHRPADRRAARGCTSTAAPTASRAASSGGSREDEGTWLGHVLEHVAIELQNVAGEPVTFGKTRGAGRRRATTTSSTSTSRRTSASRPAGWRCTLLHSLLPPELRPEGAVPGDFDFAAERDEFIRFAQRRALGPSTDVAGARRRGAAASRGSGSTSRA